MSILEFGSPSFVVLFLLIPFLFAWKAWRRSRGARDAAIRFSNLAPFRGLPATPRLYLRFLVPILRGAALALLVLVLMRPQRGSELAPESSEGLSILMVLDTSHSMTQEDFLIEGKRKSRFEAVKKVFREFVMGGKDLPGRPNDEIGIVTFAGYAVPQAPLTLDHGAVMEVLRQLELYEPELDRLGRPIGNQQLLEEELQTAIGDGLGIAVEHLKDVKAKSRVIILLSDGSQTTGVLSPVEGAELAKAFGIKIYSIGIGQAGDVMQTVNDPIFGKRLVRKRSDLDEAALKEVAETTGGLYFNAADTNALTAVYGEIDQLERSKIESSRYYRYDEKFQWAAVPALLLLVLEVLLAQTVFRRIP